MFSRVKSAVFKRGSSFTWTGGVAVLAAACMLATVALRHGFREPFWAELAMDAVAAVFALIWAGCSLRVRRGWRVSGVELSAAAFAVASLLADAFAPGFRTPPLLVSCVIVGGAATWRLYGMASRSVPSPAMIFPLSILALILMGTALLCLPRATPADQPISVLDALFTATSAVCVTGLIVRDTAEGFTPFGHTIIAVLIQLGGLGVLVFGSTLALLLGRQLSLRDHQSLGSAIDEYPTDRLVQYVRFVVITTFAVVAIGAALLYPLWEGDLTVGRRLGMSVFHSISAFCNAGFDLTGDSMVPYRGAFLPHGTLLMLIVLGSIGFPVLQELGSMARVSLSRLLPRWRRPSAPEYEPPGLGSNRRKQIRLSLQSRLVLVTTLSLYIGGVAIIFTSQMLRPGPEAEAAGVWQSLLDAHFMSLGARTAGFTSVPMDDLGAGSRFSLMLLMLVGGSPASTAGGLKTVAVAVLVMGAWATLRNRPEAEAYGRAVPDSQVKRAAAVAFTLLAIIAGTILALSFTERARFEIIAFEAVSAASTNGLTLGLTQELSPAGRVVIILSMFLGRVGPITLFASVLVGRAASTRYSYPHERVLLN